MLRAIAALAAGLLATAASAQTASAPVTPIDQAVRGTVWRFLLTKCPSGWVLIESQRISNATVILFCKKL